MASIVTIDDLVTRIGARELNHLAGIGNVNDPDGRTLDETRIGDEIAFADQLIAGYLVARYPAIGTLPTAAMPDLLKGFAADIIRYRLRAQTDDRNAVTENIRQRHNDAIGWLKDVSGGRANADLPELEDGLDRKGTPTGAVKASVPPARTDAILEGW